MIAWINFFCLLSATLLFTYFYSRSVCPAGRSMVSGDIAYQKCFHERLISFFFEGLIILNFVLFHFYPIGNPFSSIYPWPWWISVILALMIGVPASALMTIGLRDAGEEAMHPKKHHVLYSGIYTKIRHPQAAGEVFLFLVIALLLHSPFLSIYSILFFPIFILISFAEEEDLLIRYGDVYAEYCKKTGAFWPR